ncbi:unnamed protein product [Adineta steineri]|nr:unnamed protein product [Adineta steineri]
MYEKGLGLKRDLHLAKRFYDMAVEANSDAYLPVTIVLFKLYLESVYEKLFSNDKSTNKKETNSPPSVDLDSLWDLYLIAALLGLIGALYTIRRQRAVLRQRAVPVQ